MMKLCCQGCGVTSRMAHWISAQNSLRPRTTQANVTRCHSIR